MKQLPEVTAPIDIVDNFIIMLPNPNPNEFFPFVRNLNANFSNNIIVIHQDKLKGQKIIPLVQNVKKTEGNVWLLAETANKKLVHSKKMSTGFYVIAYDGTANVGKQYFPASAKATVSKSNEKTFMEDNIIDQLFQKNIFLKYDQYKYDKSLVAEAAAIRDLLKRNKR